MPKTYGTGRGMWSAENLELCLKCGSGENRDSTEGSCKRPRKSTGPPTPREPTGWNRAAYWTPEDSWHGTKPDENRYGRFNFGLPICLVSEFEPFDARFGRKSNGAGAAVHSGNGRIENVGLASDNISAKYVGILRYAQDTFLAGRNYGKPFGLHLNFPPKTS